MSSRKHPLYIGSDAKATARLLHFVMWRTRSTVRKALRIATFMFRHRSRTRTVKVPVLSLHTQLLNRGEMFDDDFLAGHLHRPDGERHRGAAGSTFSR